MNNKYYSWRKPTSLDHFDNVYVLNDVKTYLFTNRLSNILLLRTDWKCIQNFSKRWKLVLSVANRISIFKIDCTHISPTKILQEKFQTPKSDLPLDDLIEVYTSRGTGLQTSQTCIFTTLNYFQIPVFPHISDLLTFPRVLLSVFNTSNLLMLELEGNCSSLYHSCRKSMISVIYLKQIT